MKTQSPSTVVLGFVLMLAAAGLQARGDQEYIFTHVDDFIPSYNLGECYIFDLNNDNVACGTATIKHVVGGNSSITYTGFYWTQLDEKQTVELSWPKGINNNGLIAGVAAVYDLPTSVSTPLPFLPSTYAPLAMLGINDAGVTVGYVQTCSCSNSDGLNQKPYVWTERLGARTLAVPGATGAAKVNNNGLVVGWTGGFAYINSYLYDLNTESYMLMDSVFAGPNTRTRADDVNDNGVVVGSRRNAAGTITWGYTWSAGTGVTLLPLPPAGYEPTLRPQSISNSGTVVGSMFTTEGATRAFVYDAVHGVRDLNTLTSALPGFVMMNATVVNDNGWIAGYGTGGNPNPGIYTAFVLKPVNAADFNQDGAVDGADLGMLLGEWGACGGCEADINDDGTVDGADLGEVLGEWGG